MKLIFFIGHAGSGKTTVSSSLAKKTKAVYLDKDVIGKHYMDKLSNVMNLDPNDRDSDIYETQFRDMEYLAMLDIAAQNLALGNDVYVVAPFTRETRNPHWLAHYFKQHGLPKEEIDVHVVVVYIEDKVKQKERFAERNAPRDEWKLANWDVYKHTLEKPLQVAWDLPEGHVIEFHNNESLTPSRVETLYQRLHKEK